MYQPPSQAVISITHYPSNPALFLGSLDEATFLHYSVGHRLFNLVPGDETSGWSPQLYGTINSYETTVRWKE